MFSLDSFKDQTGEQLVTKFVLKPLFEAYSKLKEHDSGLVSYDENTITKKIVWYLKHETSVALYYETRLIGIEMRPKEQENIDDLYEPDIKFFIWGRLWFEIEAKRLHKGNSWTIAEYMGNNGLGRFISLL